MKNYISVIFVISFLWSCSKDDHIPNYKMEKPMTMTIFCQNAPNDTISQTDYEYDMENLIQMTISRYGEKNSVTNYEYNSDNLLINEINDEDFQKSVITYVYNQSNQLINKIFKIYSINPNGAVTDTNEYETLFEYKDNLLIKEMEIWGGWNTFEYSKGNLITKKVFTSSGQLNRVISFKYSGSFKVEERNQTPNGSIIYTRTFAYDSEGRLVRIIEDGNIIEQNIYNGNRLLEKRINYFGIDPGFFACYGNFLYKYDYL